MKKEIEKTSSKSMDFPHGSTKPLLGDVYNQILHLFVGNNETRPALMSPFIQEDFAIATDAHAIICFKKELLRGSKVKPNEKAPNALAVIPAEENMSMEFDTIEMRKQILTSRKIAKETYEVKKGKCPDCFGYRYVQYEFSDYKGRSHEIEDTCPTCENEDEWITYKNRKTGNEIESFRELIEIENALIDVNLFEKLVKTAELLSVDKIKLVYRKNELSVHKFYVGKCTICIMPVYQEGENDLVQKIS